MEIIPEGPPAQRAPYLIDGEIGNPFSVYRWRCEKGHEFRATAAKVAKEPLCPYCLVKWVQPKKSA